MVRTSPHGTGCGGDFVPLSKRLPLPGEMTASIGAASCSDAPNKPPRGLTSDPGISLCCHKTPFT
jgi:hypothetical protein